MESIEKIEFTIDDLILLQNIPNLYAIIKICFIYGSDDAYHALCSLISFGKDLSSPNKRIKYDARSELYNRLVNHIYPNIKTNINSKNLNYIEFGLSLQMLSDRWKTSYPFDELISLAFIIDIQENHEITYEGFLNFVNEIEKVIRNNLHSPKEYLDGFYDIRRENLYKLVLESIPNIELRNKLAYLAYSSYQFNIQPLALLFELDAMKTESVIGFIIELTDLMNRNTAKLLSNTLVQSKDGIDDSGSISTMQDIMPTEASENLMIPINNTIDIDNSTIATNYSNINNIDIIISNNEVDSVNIDSKLFELHELDDPQVFISTSNNNNNNETTEQDEYNNNILTQKAVQDTDMPYIIPKDFVLEQLKSFQNNTEQIVSYINQNNNDNNQLSKVSMIQFIHTMENQMYQLKELLNLNENQINIINNTTNIQDSADNITNTISNKSSKDLKIDTKNNISITKPLNFIELNKLSSIKKQIKKISTDNKNINKKNSNHNLSSPKIFTFDSTLNTTNNNNHIKSLNFNETYTINSSHSSSLVISPSNNNNNSTSYRNTIQNKNINLNIFKSPLKFQISNQQNVFYNEKWIPMKIKRNHIDKKVKINANERFQTVEDLAIAKKINQVFYKLPY